MLKDHDGAGVTIALKNMYGAIHNPNKYHPNGCDPYVADLNMLPEIRSRMKLAICDATTAMYEGGPGFKPEHSWKCNSLLVSQDPVALDYTGWQMIERKRAEMGLKTLEAEQRAPRYIATAADREHRPGPLRSQPHRGRRGVTGAGRCIMNCEFVPTEGVDRPALVPQVRAGLGSGSRRRRIRRARRGHSRWVRRGIAE